MKIQSIIALSLLALFAGASSSQADMAKKDVVLTAKYCRHLVNAKNVGGRVP
jgi:hypothetical protein